VSVPHELMQLFHLSLSSYSVAGDDTNLSWHDNTRRCGINVKRLVLVSSYRARGREFSFPACIFTVLEADSKLSFRERNNKCLKKLET